MLIYRYKQFGGVRLVWQYAKHGVLPCYCERFCEMLGKEAIFQDDLSSRAPQNRTHIDKAV